MADARRVFVVHGRNNKARKAMFRFLRSADLEPLEWDHLVKETGAGCPTIMGVLDRALEMAQAVVVLFTPDDLARLRKRYQRPGDPAQEKELTFQPRPNVLFEAGLALGRYPTRTVIVQITKDEMRSISDLEGLHIIRMDDTTAKRSALLQRLRTAGCAVQTSGTDWHSEGNFEKAM